MKLRLCLAILTMCFSTMAFAGPPTDNEVRHAYKQMALGQLATVNGYTETMGIDALSRLGSSDCPNMLHCRPLSAEEKANNRQEMVGAIEKTDVFVGEKTKAPDGTYVVVVTVNGKTSTVSMLKGKDGWIIKCYDALDGTRRCY